MPKKKLECEFSPLTESSYENIKNYHANYFILIKTTPNDSTSSLDIVWIFIIII